ncbi:hypothetical protein VaNZ11_014076, partial [Volvox africanus]
MMLLLTKPRTMTYTGSNPECRVGFPFLDCRFRKDRLCCNSIVLTSSKIAASRGSKLSTGPFSAVPSLPATSPLLSPCLQRDPYMITAYTCCGVSTRRSGAVARASQAMMQYGQHGSPRSRPQPWQVVSAVSAVAMLLCNFHRSVFTALLPLVAGSLALTPAELGLVQSSMLWGYLAGQIPAGRLADERGGDRVLLGGLALWSAATAATAAAAATSPEAALWTLLAARVAMGIFSAVIMPSVAAVTAQWVPPARKAATLAMIYAFFNVGGVLGLIVGPHLAGRSGGWPAAYITAAAGGVMWAVLGSAAVARIGTRPPLPSKRRKGQLPPPPSPLRQPHLPEAPSEQRQEQKLVNEEQVEVPDLPTSTHSLTYARPVVERDEPPSAAPIQAAFTSPSAAAQTAAASGAGRLLPGRAAASETVSISGRRGSLDPPSRMDTPPPAESSQRRSTLIQVAALCWCHGVIGWGFFVLQAWTPMYLQSL